jgi:hypothetical protein
MLPRQLNDVITGALLSGARIGLDRGKYPRYKLTAKDKSFLLWLQELLKKFSIKSFISRENNSSRIFLLNIYVNTSPFPELGELRGKWYKKVDGRTLKLFQETWN